MGNTSDFILNNAIEVGKDTKVTLGTITSGTVDLSTGNYFAETLSADTTYTFSNPGDVQSFQLEVTGGSTVVGYDLSVASYDSVSFNASSQATTPVDFFMKPDGTKMYLLDQTSGTAYQYVLSTASDLSTASYESKSFNFTSQETTVGGFGFSADGTKMYVAGSARIMFQYTLSTAWDISTASYDSVNLSLTAYFSSPRTILFNGEGTKMFVIDVTFDTVFQYTLTTGFDISTASYDSVSFNLGSQDTQPRNIFFNPDGTKLFSVGNTSDTVYEYALSTAFDLSTTTYTGTSFSVVSQVSAPGGMAFTGDGTKMYVVNISAPVVYQYSTATYTAATLTWPASVQWSAGVAPTTPAAGETDVYTFVTDDGGTTYIGLQTADNLS